MIIHDDFPNLQSSVHFVDGISYHANGIED